MVFNKIEDKLTRLILTVLCAIILLGIGFAMVRFLPPLLKLIGGVVDVITLWGVIKYLRFEFKKKEK